MLNISTVLQINLYGAKKGAWAGERTMLSKQTTLRVQSRIRCKRLTYYHLLPRAVVTGCTSGIGREFAQQLSKAGFRVLLVSRDEKALAKLQTELSACSLPVTLASARVPSS